MWKAIQGLWDSAASVWQTYLKQTQIADAAAGWRRRRRSEGAATATT